MHLATNAEYLDFWSALTNRWISVDNFKAKRQEQNKSKNKTDQKRKQLTKQTWNTTKSARARWPRAVAAGAAGAGRTGEVEIRTAAVINTVRTARPIAWRRLVEERGVVVVVVVVCLYFVFVRDRHERNGNGRKVGQRGRQRQPDRQTDRRPTVWRTQGPHYHTNTPKPENIGGKRNARKSNTQKTAGGGGGGDPYAIW
jgi:hypothetical protein